MNATLLAAIGVGTNTRPSTHTLTDAPGHTAADQPPQPPGLPIYLILEPVDMRLGIDGLSACVQHRLQQPPCAGGLYLFSNARRNRLKLLLWDATGVWLAQRRLHQCRFVWPMASPSPPSTIVKPHITLTLDQWQWLSQGVDWRRLSASVQSHANWRVA